MPPHHPTNIRKTGSRNFWAKRHGSLRRRMIRHEGYKILCIFVPPSFAIPSACQTKFTFREMKIFNLVQALLLATVANAGFLRRKGYAPGVVDVADANASDPIRKSKSDRRTYFHTTLDSGLKVLLVEDPEAQKSSYAMAVEVGSLEDPKGFQGLAHFCEHMVFLGSKKYPEEDKFSDRLAFFGGQSNAYTASDQTVYYAEVSDEGFQETFDIFAQFFIEPSFAANMVDKEINAVDSEHKKNMPDTTWRLFHLMKSRANPLSPVSQFSTGNLKTLKTDPEKDGRSLPEALKKFHKEHYCPSRMHLVIMQNASIAQQLHAVHRSFDVFGKNAGNCKSRPTYDTVETYSHKLGNLGRKFTVHTDGKYREQPEAYIHYAMNHYGQGGLKALLKREDLSMSYSTMAETSTAGTLLFVIFELTEKGVRESDRVMEHFFGYFQTLQKEGVNKNILEKIQSLNQVMFDYQDRSGSESG
eukprot:s2559_g6.t1